MTRTQVCTQLGQQARAYSTEPAPARRKTGHRLRNSLPRFATHVKAVRAEGLHVEEEVSVGLDAVQDQVDRDQHELPLDVLVRHGAAVALRGTRRAFEQKTNSSFSRTATTHVRLDRRGAGT